MKAVLGLLLRFAMLIALLLGAWGFDDLRGFFAHPARAGLVLALAATGVAATILFPNLRAFQKGEKRTGTGLLVAWIVACVLIFAWYPYADRRGLLVMENGEWLRYLGLMMLVVGMALRLYSARYLGRQFSGWVALQKDHELIQNGPYAIVRHPLYTGLLLAFAGFGLIFRSWVVLGAIVLTVAFILVRVRQEETLLAGEFGSKFDDYRQRTWRLVPWVY